MIPLTQSLNLQSIRNPGITLAALGELLKSPAAKTAIFHEHAYDLKDPETPASVLELVFSNKCGTFTPRLQKYLGEHGIKSVAATSPEQEGDFHVYAVLLIEESLIILDPSLGQYVKGYRDIFIGSRVNLRDLILSEATEFHSVVTDREKFFSNTWGMRSVTAFAPAKLIIYM